jgi:Phage tail assembly chaperone protein, TAC
MRAETRIIDNRTYEFFFLPPKDALRTLVRILKIVGEPIGAITDLFSSFDGKSLDMKISELPPGIINNAVTALVNRLDEDQVMQIIEDLMGSTHVKTENDRGTRPIQFAVDFCGRIGHLFKVVKASLEVNYADFFGDGTGLYDSVMKASKDMRSVQQI